MARAPTGLVMAALVAVAAGGCKPEDRGRPLTFTPGVYQGEPMPALNAEQVERLQKRGNLLK
jgi:hypothetical protein